MWDWSWCVLTPSEKDLRYKSYQKRFQVVWGKLANQGNCAWNWRFQKNIDEWLHLPPSKNYLNSSFFWNLRWGRYTGWGISLKAIGRPEIKEQPLAQGDFFPFMRKFPTRRHSQQAFFWLLWRACTWGRGFFCPLEKKKVFFCCCCFCLFYNDTQY